MNMCSVELECEERFNAAPELTKEKLENAVKVAINKLEKNLNKFYDHFPGTCSVNFKYEPQNGINWESGMLTGSYLLAYQLTGDKKYLEICENHVEIYARYAEKNKELNDHDTGFIFIPSCVAMYKITGSEKSKNCGIKSR